MLKVVLLYMLYALAQFVQVNDSHFGVSCQSKEKSVIVFLDLAHHAHCSKQRPAILKNALW